MIDLSGKSAIVTGGASGIGEQTVRKLAELGARVTIADVDEEKGASLAAELSGAGKDILFVRTDILKEADIAALSKNVTGQFGGINIVVNSAGIPRTIAPDFEVVEMDINHW